MRTRSRRIEEILWMAIGAVLCWEAFGLGTGTLRKPDMGFAPLLTGILLISFGLVLTIRNFLSGAVEEEGSVRVKRIGGRGALSLVALCAYPLLLESLGFILDTFLFLFFIFKIMEPRKWRSPLLISGAAVLVSYFLFIAWLRIGFPRGVFNIG